MTPLEPVPFNRRLDSGDRPIERMFPNRDPETLALAERGIDAMQAKDYARAVDELSKALARNPKDEGIKETLRQARALLSGQKAQQVRDSGRQGQRAAPGERGTDVAAQMAKGNEAIRAGDMDAADSAYTLAWARGSDEDLGLQAAYSLVGGTTHLEEGSRELFLAAVENLRDENYTAAGQQLREAVERNPGDSGARDALYRALGLLSSANQELLSPLSRSIVTEPLRAVLGDSASNPLIACGLERAARGDNGGAFLDFYNARREAPEDQRIADAYQLLTGYYNGQNGAVRAARARAARSRSLFDPTLLNSFHLLEMMTPPQEQTLKETILTAVRPVNEAMAAADRAIIEFFGRTFVKEQTPIADANLENMTVVAVRVGEVQNEAAGILVEEALRSMNAGDLATAGLMPGRAAERDPGNEAIAEASRYVQGLYEVNRQIGTDTGQPQQPSFAAVQNSVTAAGMMVTGGPSSSIQARALAEEAVESIRIGDLDRASGLLEAAAIREPDSEGIQAARAFVNYIVERGPEPAPSTAAARYDRETENLTGAA